MVNNHIEEDHNDQKLPKDPVGMTDSDEHCSNELTEPPDEKEGKQGVDGELRAKDIESRESRRVNTPEDDGVERDKGTRTREDKLRGVEGETGARAKVRTEAIEMAGRSMHLGYPQHIPTTPSNLPTMSTHHIVEDDSRWNL
ncbi:hypothetical protein BDN67DRAFT_984460 [Paxillus ammoniavirescens]|nr:hypothetical protein BDN67DRAFT_984460 [Paxillus ammoniavirescens]